MVPNSVIRSFCPLPMTRISCSSKSILSRVRAVSSATRSPVANRSSQIQRSRMPSGVWTGMLLSNAIICSAKRVLGRVRGSFGKSRSDQGLVVT